MEQNYFKTINGYHYLEPQEELKLAEEMRAGKSAARDTLIYSHLRMVLPIVRRYKKHNIPLEDLIQEGNLGLITAVDKFDPSHNTRLATYARAWVEEFIKRKVYKEHFVTDLPQKYVKSVLNRGDNAELGALEALKNPVYIDYQMDEESGSYERLKDERDLPDERAEKRELKSFLNKKIRYILNEEESMIIEKRFFSQKSTYKEIGNAIHFSLETVRNKEKKACEKLKRELRKDLLER